MGAPQIGAPTLGSGKKPIVWGPYLGPLIFGNPHGSKGSELGCPPLGHRGPYEGHTGVVLVPFLWVYDLRGTTQDIMHRGLNNYQSLPPNLTHPPNPNSKYSISESFYIYIYI